MNCTLCGTELKSELEDCPLCESEFFVAVLPEEDDVSESGVIEGCTTLIVGKGGKDEVNSAGWDGLIDEVRIYGRVLSAGEVMWLAGRTQSVHKPL